MWSADNNAIAAGEVPGNETPPGTLQHTRSARGHAFNRCGGAQVGESMLQNLSHGVSQFPLGFGLELTDSPKLLRTISKANSNE